MTNSSVYPCPQCEIGRLHEKEQTYVTLLQGMVVSVPDVPLWSCDMCGYHEYELAALQLIDSLVVQTKVNAGVANASRKIQSLDSEKPLPPQKLS